MNPPALALSPVYDPHEVEEKWYAAWLEKAYFKGEVQKDKEPFSIVIPPPNVTGSLHMGHALNNTIQDILIRWKKMEGFSTCWFPGTDHAGIATQVVVEKELRKKENMTRHDLGRDEFVKRVWEWKKEYGGIIDSQLKKLGVSCDWDRYSFTMDEKRARAVKEAFVRLYEKGLIYRERYIVNWCPRCLTALSDLEVEHRENEAPGILYHLKYPLLDSREKNIVIATTRPETILADVAVAVHPDDSRYKGVIGKYAVLPIVGRKLKIIADLLADPEVGTGAVKITPAHDPNDFEVGKRHGLPSIVVIDPEGKMMMQEIQYEEEISKQTKDWLRSRYQGLDRFKCREKILEDLKEFKILVKEESWPSNPGRCARCGEMIEPYLSLQWFMKMKELAQPAIQVVKEERICFHPERFSRLYLDWMGNIRDWCISRQLWWGHRIPAWYCLECNEKFISISGHGFGAGPEPEALTSASIPITNWHYTIRQGAKPIVAREEPSQCETCGGKNLVQDEDVLDTWFSSALWPLSVMGWPDETDDLKYFYPTTVLSTGRDIIYLWVARMIMMGLEFRKEIPFHHVYIHPTILDREGKRMSKSKGTGVDPLDLIKKYGADATRFGMIFISQGQDVRFNGEKIEQARNFANKVWNASRFVLSNLPQDFSRKDENDRSSFLKFYDHWILFKLSRLVESVTQDLKDYEFANAASRLYDFFWDDFCDWYLELSKTDLQSEDEKRKNAVHSVLLEILTISLKLLHPFMPFLTEEIWQHAKKNSTLLLGASWPVKSGSSADGQHLVMETFIEAVKGIRNLRAEIGLKPKDQLPVVILTDQRHIFEKMEKELVALAQASSLTIFDEKEKAPPKALSFQTGSGSIYIPLEGVIDIGIEIARLRKEHERSTADLLNVKKKLADPSFMEKAKKEVVEKERGKEKQIVEKLNRIAERIRLLTE